MNDITKYQPQHGGAISTTQPSIPSYGIAEAFFAKRQARRTTKVTDALADMTAAATRLKNNQTSLILADNKNKEALFESAILPKKLENEMHVRQLEWADRIRTAQHIGYVNEVRRETERVQVHGVLEDARQQVKALREYGPKVRALQYEKQLVDEVDLQLDKTQKKKLIEEVKKQPTSSEELPVSKADMTKLLLGYRAELEASSRDTRAVEKALAELDGK